MIQLSILLGMLLVLFCLSRIKPEYTHLFLIPIVIIGCLFLAPIPFRNMLVGMFGYLDQIMLVAMGLILLGVLLKTQILDNIIRSWVYLLRKNYFLTLLVLLLIGLIPGMLTGSALIALAVNGAILLPVLSKLGLDTDKSSAFVLLTSILGMIAPPVNIPVIIYCGVIDQPYVGISAPLWWIVLPGIILTTAYFWLVSKGNQSRGFTEAKFRIQDYVGLALLLVFALVKVLLPTTIFGQIGWPLILLLITLIQYLCVLKESESNLLNISYEAILDGISILGILLVSGIFVHLSNFTGLKGVLVAQLASLPQWLSGGILIFALLVLGSLWENIGFLFMIPLLAAYSGYDLGIVGVFSAFLALGAAVLPWNIRKPIIPTYSLEQVSWQATLIPAGLVVVWSGIVLWQLNWFLNLLF